MIKKKFKNRQSLQNKYIKKENIFVQLYNMFVFCTKCYYKKVKKIF
jgi:hypothetical protein